MKIKLLRNLIVNYNQSVSKADNANPKAWNIEKGY